MEKNLQLTLLGGIPYGLEVQWSDTFGRLQTDILTIGNYHYNIKNCGGKPLLFNIDSLIKECLPDGKIPIVELAKLVDPSFNEYFDIQKFPAANDGEFGYYVSRKYSDTFLTFVFCNNMFYMEFEDLRNTRPFNQQILFDQMDAWHFNRRNLSNEQYKLKA